MLKDISRKSKTYCEVSKLYEIIFGNISIVLTFLLIGRTSSIYI